MVARVDTAYVHLWGHRMGAVAWDPDRQVATFEFDPAFLKTGLDPAPLQMPLTPTRRSTLLHSFPELPRRAFRGLPGLLADALPDNFGNRVINAWLARQGRDPASFSPVERLCYTGKRAMGALEFAPAINKGVDRSVAVEIDALVALAQEVTRTRSQIKGDLDQNAPTTLLDLIRVGTSAGGARPKVVIALNAKTKAVRSGQVAAPAGYDHWILKLDGVGDQTLSDPAGYGRIEYAYHKMAVAAGIEMTACRLLEENGRAHFMTRRFDRPTAGDKRHMQTLCALAHFDFNRPGAYSYEQTFQVMRQLRLPYSDAEQQFRRMVFNIVARNQDDHTKNITFLMAPDGTWRLSPAYDVIFAYNPAGQWTSRHQMTVNGKQDDFEKADLLQVGRQMNIKRRAAVIDEVVTTVAAWPAFAARADVNPAQIKAIGSTHRLLV